MSTVVGQRLAKNKIVRDTSGAIIDWFDEVNGGWIVQKRVVVNMDAWNAHLQKEKDRAEAASAIGKAKIRDDYPETREGTNTSNAKVDELDKKVNAMDEKLNAILEVLKK